MKDIISSDNNQEASKKDLVYSHGKTNPEKLEQDLEFVRDWLKFQPHLPHTIGDNIIKQYIIGAKGNLENAKRKLDANYTVRHDMAAFFKNRDPNSIDIDNSYKSTLACICPELSDEGCRITVFSFEKDMSKYYNPNEDIKRVFMYSDLWLKQGHLYCGEDVILDLKNFGDKYNEKLGVQCIVMWINTLKLLPTRLNKFIVINANGFIETFFKLVKPFMAEKLQNRIHITSAGSEILSKHFNCDVLPKDFGGSLDITVKDLSDFWFEQMKQNRDWFIDDSNFFSVESKRIETTLNGDHGLSGTFRRINID